MTINDLADLNERLSRSAAINALEQVIMKLDVTVEAMQRTMDQVKKLKEKLEDYGG